MKKVYLHSLTITDLGKGNGWYAPSELPDNTNYPVSFVIPLNSRKELYKRYWVEMFFYRGKGGSLTWDECFFLEKINSKTLVLKTKVMSILFKYKKQTILPYKGNLYHSDFEHNLIQIDMKNHKQEELLFDKTNLIIMGYDPCNYRRKI